MSTVLARAKKSSTVLSLRMMEVSKQKHHLAVEMKMKFILQANLSWSRRNLPITNLALMSTVWNNKNSYLASRSKIVKMIRPGMTF